MSIADQLTQLNQVKSGIKQALIDKGVDMSGIPFTKYAEKVEEFKSIQINKTLCACTLSQEQSIAGKMFYKQIVVTPNKQGSITYSVPVSCGYNNSTTFEITLKTDNSASNRRLFTFVTSISNVCTNNMWMNLIADLRTFCTPEEIANHKNLIVTVSGVAGLLMNGEAYSY